MQEIFQQLGELVLGSLPTVVFFLCLLAAYAFLVRGPLERTLAERHARMGGAIEEAHRAVSVSEEKAAEYENRLRHARAEIFEARQARLKAAGEARERSLDEARSQAGKRIAAARASVEQSGVDIRREIEASASGLSEQILAAILPEKARVSEAVR